ncbi:hypothetical protein Hypma_003659 [Hypsizygus marmoreus]|uniref:Uncharacterized protein n=1 Tax=Hypsizygus marmoreus TaxID=39966 RepID=A0A369J1I6_HYPMA|nr:hypothetical protein Hypma_003659 [Hypsizygus marmoreus]
MPPEPAGGACGELKHRDINRRGVPDHCPPSDAPIDTIDKQPTTTAAIVAPRDKMRASSFFSYSPKTTSISFPWPQEVNGLERIALSAQGDLQRVLRSVLSPQQRTIPTSHQPPHSAFFARPISIALVYSNTFYHPTPSELAVPLTLPNPTAIASASPASPIVQTRQVHLQCSGKIVCTATSTVRITSPKCAHLFLEEKYAIGQMFSRLEKVPAFELLAVGLGPVTDSPPGKVSVPVFGDRLDMQQLWRRYKLFIADFECEILEVFPSRDMFVGGEKWLDDKEGWTKESFNPSVKHIYLPTTALRAETALILFLGLGFLLMLAFELSLYFTGRQPLC